MKFYIKATIFTSFMFICLSLGLFYKNSHQSNNRQVYQLFEAADYKMALAYTNELEESSNSAKFPLYKAYILREQDKLTESTAALKKALRRLIPSQTVDDLAEEIHLNLLLNAFLSRDHHQFQESLSNFRPLPPSLNPYIDLFFGIEAFLNQDYQKALPIFQKHQLHYSSIHSTSFSPWMKLVFEEQFNKDWINKHIVICFIEESLYSLANKKLDEMLDDNNMDSIHLLRSFCYFKQSRDNPCEIALTLHASALHEINVLNLKKIRTDKELADDLKKMVLSLQAHILKFAKTGSLDEFSLYLNSFQFFANEEEIEILAKLLIKIINQLDEDTSFTLLQKIEGKTLVKLLYINRQLMEEMIKKGDLENLNKTMQLMKPFSSKDFDFVASTNKIATEFALTCLKGESAKTELGVGLLNFYSQHETDPKSRLELAKKLVDLAKYSWLQENYEKAIKIWKMAKDFPSNQDKPLILENLEQTIFSLYKNAANHELGIPCFYAAKAVKILELNRLTLCNQKQKNRIIEDATYFYSKGHNNIAREKALFILELDPENEVANRIIGLIAYENGNFEKAYAHLIRIKQPNLNILEILKQIKPE